ncbi:MAG: DUF115 domain-containing protein [Methanothrix sp.]|nr:DUF115 domain-containing protein [Methanothrix sp.]
MRFEDWEPLYLAILDDLGFSREADEEAAALLQSLLLGREDILDRIDERVRGRDVVVCGNAPSLEEELEGLLVGERSILAADGAAAVLLRCGIVPDVLVTDLDGPIEAILEADRRGALVVVHAHGDNQDALRRYVPLLGGVLGTAQCRPPEGLYNFGGFTDGDRCVFLARELGAASIHLVGFDLDDESVTPRKRRKLAWARRLIGIALDG